MPKFELSLILKPMVKEPLKQALKGVTREILKAGGGVYKYENLGKRTLPYTLKRNQIKYEEGHYFMVYFDLPSSKYRALNGALNSVDGVLRPSVMRQEEEMMRPCMVRQCYFGYQVPEKLKELHKFGRYHKNYDIEQAFKKTKRLQKDVEKEQQQKAKFKHHGILK